MPRVPILAFGGPWVWVFETPSSTLPWGFCIPFYISFLAGPFFRGRPYQQLFAKLNYTLEGAAFSVPDRFGV